MLMYIKEIAAQSVNLPSPCGFKFKGYFFSLIGKGPSECQSQSD